MWCIHITEIETVTDKSTIAILQLPLLSKNMENKYQKEGVSVSC